MVEYLVKLLQSFTGSVWFVILLAGVGVAFFVALLWKILRSEEGFLFGYGNWVIGKWQPAKGHGHGHGKAGARGEAVRAEAARTETDEASSRKADQNAHKRALQVKGNVLTLSRLLDGDLAYLIMNNPVEWDTKFWRAVQTLISGVTRVVRISGRCRCGFFILEENGEQLVLAVGEGYPGIKRPRLGLDHSCAGRAFQTGDNYYCRNTTTDPVYWHSERGNKDFRSIACVPVRAGAAVFGVICLDATEPDAFTTDDFVHLEVFAAKLAVFCAVHTQVTGPGGAEKKEG